MSRDDGLIELGRLVRESIYGKNEGEQMTWRSPASKGRVDPEKTTDAAKFRRVFEYELLRCRERGDHTGQRAYEFAIAALDRRSTEIAFCPACDKEWSA